MKLLAKLLGIESTIQRLDAALDAANAQTRAPSQTEKRKAAMALNLCATSISRILAADDLEVMDVEYESILNNLNLQNMLKDEALLSTFKSILDTITFYRLQAGDKKRAEVRYQQQLNNAIWNASSQGACILFASATNPTPWAVVSGAIMAVGAFCNVKKARAAATVAHDDEEWKLERSLIEQLHALRYSLFETSWRLADRYGFDDAWRLTEPQIEQYNKMLSEPDPAWRYFKLIQYKKNFEAYPYYWNELGESAFQAAVATEDETLRSDYLSKAEEAFDSFAGKDMGLLREDMIAAAAYLRRVQIAHERSGSWAAAIGDADAFVERIAGLACSAPDLLMQGAICLAADYEETKDARCLKCAISLLEMVVGQDYDTPSSSRLLSRLYLESDEYANAYASLRNHVGEFCVVDKDDQTGTCLIELDYGVVRQRLKNVLPTLFDHAVSLSNGGLFNGTTDEVDKKVAQFIDEKSLKRDSSVVDMLMDIWSDMKTRFNDEILVCANAFGIPLEDFSDVAREMDSSAQGKIKEYSGDYANLVFSKDRSIQQQRSLNRILGEAKTLFVDGVDKVVWTACDDQRHEGVERIDEGVSAIERHIAREKQRYGIVHVDDKAGTDVFTMSASDITADDEISWTEYRENPAWGDKMIEEHKSFRVTVDSLRDVITASQQLEDDIERKGCRVRVYTYGSILACVNLPLVAAWAFHRLATAKPDYEVVRYPKSVEVRYKHDDIHDTSSDASPVRKVIDSVCDEGKGVKRLFCEAGEKVVEAKEKVVEVGEKVVEKVKGLKILFA